jgi:hypothetical protein
VTALVLCLCLAPVPKADAALTKLFGSPADPGKKCTFDLDGDVLTVGMPAEHHTLTASGGSHNAPRTERDAGRDFTATVELKATLPDGAISDVKGVDPGVGGGIVLWIDAKNYAALIRVHEAQGGGNNTSHELHYILNGEELGDSAKAAAYVDTWHRVRLTRKGAKLKAEQSPDGKIWQSVAEIDFTDKPGKLGIFAEHNTQKPAKVQFRGFGVK